MGAQAREIVADLESNPPPLPPQEVEEGKALLNWLADDHFTFLGYRVPSRDRGGRRAAGGARHRLRSCAPTRTCPRRSGSCRRWSRRRPARRPCSCWPRPTPRRPCTVRFGLDYVGVKTFDDQGEVVGASLPRALLLGRLHRVADPHPGDPQEGRRRSSTGRLRAAEPHRQGHGRAGDLPARRAVPDADRRARADRRGRAAHPRAPPARLFVRRDTYGRYLSCLVYLLRDRYTTQVRERIASILKTQLHGESLEYTARVSESMLARLHFVVRPPKGELIGSSTTTTSSAGSPRRPAPGATTSSRPSTRSTARRRARDAPGLLRRVPGGLQGGLPAPHRRGGPRPAGGHRGRGGRRPVVLPADGLRPARGAAQGVPGRPAALAQRGAAGAELDGGRGRRRAALRAGRPRRGSRGSTTSACATTARCPPAAASCSRTRSPPCGTTTTRSTASTRSSSRPG